MASLSSLKSQFTFEESVDRLGSGNFGTVYRAVDVKTDRLVAIKVVEKGRKHDLNCKSELFELDVDLVQDEHRFLKDLNHPFITRLHSYYDEPDMVIMVMDLAWGGTLDEMVRPRSIALNEMMRDKEVKSIFQPDDLYLSINFAGSIFMQLVSAAIYLHSRSLIHRDIKPHNVFFSDRNRRFIKLGDFGTCCWVSDNKAKRLMIGTPAYMPPDGFRSEVTELFDCWSLGVMLFELIELRLPFPGITGPSYWKNEDLKITYSHSRPDVPKDLHKLISRLLCEMENRLPSKKIPRHPAMLTYFRSLHTMTI